MLETMKKHKDTASHNVVKLKKEIDVIHEDLKKAQNELTTFKKNHVEDKQQIMKLK